MHKILVIRLYFILDAVRVSDYVSPSSGATFISCISHLVYASASGQTYWHILAYTKYDVQLIKLLLMMD